MLYPLQGHHALRCFPDFRTIPSENHDLKAYVLVQMNMQAGLNYAAEIVLNLGEIVHQAPLRMVVEDGDHSHPLPVDVAHPFEVDYIIPYGISNALRTGGIAPIRYYLIELIKKILWQ